MDKHFVEMNAEDREKIFPNGYFASLEKGGGIVLVICGLVIALFGALSGYVGYFILKGYLSGDRYEGIVGAFAAFFIIALVLIIPGILVIRFGIRRKKKNTADWVAESAKISNYPESVILDFDWQLTRDGCICFQLAGASSGIQSIGYLTEDYIIFHNLMYPCVLKISDIIGAYLVLAADGIDRRYRETKSLNIVIPSMRRTQISCQVKQAYGEQLIALLKERNPDIDTKNNILSAEEYDALMPAEFAE